MSDASGEVRILRDDHRPELTAHESDDGDFDLIRVTECGLGEHFYDFQLFLNDFGVSYFSSVLYQFACDDDLYYDSIGAVDAILSRRR